MSKSHGQGSTEKIVLYDPGMSVAPHVYNKDRRYAVLVVDMLYDFVYGKIKTDRALPIIPKSGDLADAARSADIPVFYPNDSHTRRDFEIQRWGEHAMRGIKGAKVISALRPRKKDVEIPKTTYSSFHDTRLEKELKRAYDGKGAKPGVGHSHCGPGSDHSRDNSLHSRVHRIVRNRSRHRCNRSRSHNRRCHRSRICARYSH